MNTACYQMEKISPYLDQKKDDDEDDDDKKDDDNDDHNNCEGRSYDCKHTIRTEVRLLFLHDTILW